MALSFPNFSFHALHSELLLLHQLPELPRKTIPMVGQVFPEFNQKRERNVPFSQTDVPCHPSLTYTQDQDNTDKIQKNQGVSGFYWFKKNIKDNRVLTSCNPKARTESVLNFIGWLKTCSNVLTLSGFSGIFPLWKSAWWAKMQNRWGLENVTEEDIPRQGTI